MTGEVPTFSYFSAVSEVFVTIGVLYGVITCLRGNKLPKVLMGSVLTFELCVNVVYMATRAAHADKSAELSDGMKLFFMGHGTLSLLMFIAIVAAYLLALTDESRGRQNWFARNRGLSYVLIFFWMVSVLSGEAIFVMQLLA